MSHLNKHTNIHIYIYVYICIQVHSGHFNSRKHFHLSKNNNASKISQGSVASKNNYTSEIAILVQTTPARYDQVEFRPFKVQI